MHKNDQGSLILVILAYISICFIEKRALTKGLNWYCYGSGQGNEHDNLAGYLRV